VIVWLVSPGANWTVPLGSWPPSKSSAVGRIVAAAVDRVLDAGRAAGVANVRVTVNVNGVMPLFPSALLASAAAIDSEASSFRIVPVPVPAAIVAPLGFDSTTVNVSSGSTTVSPLTCTVTVLDSSRQDRTSPPDSPSAGNRCQTAVAVSSTVLTVTETGSALACDSVIVNTNSVVPLFPSARVTLLIDSVAESSLRIVLLAVAVSIVAPLGSTA
jgi:hypothetical protein